jgi:hypothetical protein
MEKFAFTEDAVVDIFDCCRVHDLAIEAGFYRSMKLDSTNSSPIIFHKIITYHLIQEGYLKDWQYSRICVVDGFFPGRSYRGHYVVDRLWSTSSSEFPLSHPREVSPNLERHFILTNFARISAPRVYAATG